MRALRSPSQLREQMTWFWMNHFSVFSGKANLRWTLAEYEEQGRCARTRSASSATWSWRPLTSPAMLEYLDNAQSAAGKINENYARELMELHTLGVSGGPSGSRYTQQDVQELARVLTGVGLNLTDNTPRFGPAQQALYIRRGLFEFNPARHDTGEKTVLGHERSTARASTRSKTRSRCSAASPRRRVSSARSSRSTSSPTIRRPRSSTGWRAPSRRPTDRSRPCCGRCSSTRISRKRSTHRSSSWRSSRTRCSSSSRRCGWPTKSKTLTNYHPAVNWLQQLGEPLYGRVTPDGYPLTEPAWTSSGQLVRRFEIARAIGSGDAGLFNAEDNSPGPATGFPMLTSRLYYDAIEPALGVKTHQALEKTSSQQEWNTILLASPDWMQR